MHIQTYTSTGQQTREKRTTMLSATEISSE